MAEVLRSFEEPIGDDSGEYQARVVGRLAEDGMWEGWLEFIPIGGRAEETQVSTVESRQPEREHLVYWATGLTVIYAEGSLQRAKRPVTVRTPVVEIPVSDAPKPSAVTAPRRAVGPEPILDPFEVGSRSLDILAQKLRAIGRARMLNIITAYDLNPLNQDLQTFTDAQLIGFIVAAVENAVVQRRG
jgi:hypothetical protein